MLGRFLDNWPFFLKSVIHLFQVFMNKMLFHRWTEDEISALSWNYMQSSTHADVIGKITSQLREDGIDKTKESVIRELFRQNLIGRNIYERELKEKCQENTSTVKLNKESQEDEIARLCEHLRQDGKSTCLDWVQKVLLEICYAKLCIQRRNLKKVAAAHSDSKLLGFQIFRAKSEDLPVVSPVAYYSLSKYLPIGTYLSTKYIKTRIKYNCNGPTRPTICSQHET